MNLLYGERRISLTEHRFEPTIPVHKHALFDWKSHRKMLSGYLPTVDDKRYSFSLVFNCRAKKLHFEREYETNDSIGHRHSLERPATHFKTIILIKSLES
jgi:hypothetical protein